MKRGVWHHVFSTSIVYFMKSKFSIKLILKLSIMCTGTIHFCKDYKVKSDKKSVQERVSQFTIYIMKRESGGVRSTISVS